MSGKNNKKRVRTEIDSSDSDSEDILRKSNESSSDVSSDSTEIVQKKSKKLNKKKIIKRIIESDSETDGPDEVSNESDDSEKFMKAKKNIKPEKTTKNSNEIFKELIKYQLTDVPPQWKLNINDMKRICKYINTSIFDETNCCIWNGYITNMNNSNKGTYVNFYFRNKKVALHRLLYSNFVAPLDSSEYLKFNCSSKGICCNVNHYEKYKYSKNTTLVKKESKPRETKKDIKDIVIIGTADPDQLVIDFD